MLKKKKATIFGLQQIIIVILILIVIFSVTIFLLKPGWLSWIKNLPGFGQILGDKTTNSITKYFAEKNIPVISNKNIGDAEVMDKARASKYYFEDGSNEKLGIMVFIADQSEKFPYAVYGNNKIVYVYSNGKWHPFATVTPDNKVKEYVPYNVLKANIGSKPQ